MIKKRFYNKKSTKDINIYECDMCGKEIYNKDKITIYEYDSQKRKNKKIYDLCSHCYKVLQKSIYNYKNKKNGGINGNKNIRNFN